MARVTARAGELGDELVVGGTPGGAGANPSPALPGTTTFIHAQAWREYVASTIQTWYRDYPRALPWSLDDITTDFGDDIYERMLFDSQVRSVVNVVKSGMLETGAEVSPAITDKTNPEYADAVKIADDAARMLGDMSTALDDVLWDMFDGVAFGHKAAELVFELDTAPSGRKLYMLDRMAVKPRRSISFVVNAYKRILGVLGRIPGEPFNLTSGMLLTDPKYVDNILPRSKFAIFTFRPVDGDPRGTSILRAAFDPWNAKTQSKREFLKYLSQFATPSLIAFQPEAAQPQEVYNTDGTLLVDDNGVPILRSPAEDILATLLGFANGTVSVLPHGSAVQAIMNSGEGQAFLQAFALFDRQIAKAVLNQTLATEEGQHQSRAASGTHKDVMDMLIRQAKRSGERMLERDGLGTWMILNGMQKQMHLRPRVSLGQMTAEDKARIWAAVAQLKTSGYLDPSQYPELDKEMGLPERQQAAAVDDAAAGEADPSPADGAPPADGTQSAQGTDAGAGDGGSAGMSAGDLAREGDEIMADFDTAYADYFDAHLRAAGG